MLDTLKNNWANGVYTHQEHFATAVKNAEAIGHYRGIAEVHELEYSELEAALYAE